MYGAWIGGEKPIEAKGKLANGSVVYLIDDSVYTKMVAVDPTFSQQTVGKYYKGKIGDFNSAAWDTYNNASTNYQVKNVDTTNSVPGNNKRLIEKIQLLQDSERTLHSALTSGSSGASGERSDYITQAAKEINTFSSQRSELFNQLKISYTNATENLEQTDNVLNNQITAIEATEEQLNQSKKHINELKITNNNKLRVVEFNTYSIKEYDTHIEIIKMSTWLCIMILLLLVLSNKGIIPSSVSYGGIMVASVIGSFLILKKLADLVMRDNMNFDEYDWGFDPDAQAPSVYEYDMNQLGLSGGMSDVSLPGFGCVGSSCCSGTTTYDDVTMKCVSGTNDSDLAEVAGEIPA